MDMTKYTNIFIEESRDHLQSLNEKLLLLEADKSAKGVLDEIFRSAHTLKGMSATMGFSHMAELTHKMENVLQRLRASEIKIDTRVIDTLFKCLDQLEKMVEDIAAGGEGRYQDPEIINLLESQESDSSDNPQNTPDNASEPERFETEKVDLNEYESNLLLEGQKQGFYTYHITVNIRPSCIMKSARSYMIFKKLEQVGEVVKTMPSVEDIENEKFEDSFELVFLSREEAGKIRQAIVSIAEVDEPEISRVDIRSRDDIEINRSCQSIEEPQEKKLEIICNDRECEIVMPAKKMKMTPTVRVDIDRLDTLMNLVGELVINKTRLEQIARQNPEPEMTEALEQTNRLTLDLQNIVMKVRMVPVDMVFNRFPRMVRDLAKELNKEISFVIEGSETELDRTVIDEIGEPLVHLLRNAVDHGIESPDDRVAMGKPPKGRILLRAKYEGNFVIIEVIDDGKGIDFDTVRKKLLQKGLLDEETASRTEDKELVNYLMAPGFSTAEVVTDISGRGVGLDAVKNKIESLSGDLCIESQKGVGTKFTIQLPLTLAIIQALLVQVGTEIYSIPLSFIAETTFITTDQIKLIQEQEVMLLREQVLPLIRLQEVYEVPGETVKDGEVSVVVVKKGEKKVGLIADHLIGQQEIVIKSIGEILGNVPAIAGATILGNGEVSLIVDVNSLF